MVPNTYTDYFLTAASAGAALIGLLFVAVSLRPDSVFGEQAPPSGRALAGSSFTALVNAFFVSLIAVIPKTNLGVVAAVMSLVSLLATFRLHRGLAGREQHRLVLIFSMLSFTVQLATGVGLAVRPHEQSLVGTLCYLTISSFGVALTRAWLLMQGKHLDPSPSAPRPVP